MIIYRVIRRSGAWTEQGEKDEPVAHYLKLEDAERQASLYRRGKSRNEDYFVDSVVVY